jgi:hypothetical protein
MGVASECVRASPGTARVDRIKSFTVPLSSHPGWRQSELQYSHVTDECDGSSPPTRSQLPGPEAYFFDVSSATKSRASSHIPVDRALEPTALKQAPHR